MTSLGIYVLLLVLPLILLVIITWVYIKKRKGQSVIDKENKKFDKTEFIVPSEEGVLEMTNKSGLMESGLHQRKLPINYNENQHLSKYNIGTYRNNKGRFESLKKEDE